MGKTPLSQIIVSTSNNLTDISPRAPQEKEVKELLLKIALRVKELRYKAGFTQDYFHNHLGINISRIEMGKHNVSIKTLHRICYYLKTDLENFFSGING